MSTTSEHLKRLKKEAQLKASIQQEQVRISASTRKERYGKLIAWGVAVEQTLICINTYIRQLVKIHLCRRINDSKFRFSTIRGGYNHSTQKAERLSN